PDPSIGRTSECLRPCTAAHAKRWPLLMRRMLAIAMSSGVLHAPVARADSIEFGAAYRCEANVFEIAGVVEQNDQVTVITRRQGHASRLPHGDHALRCNVGGRRVTATVKVHPASNGECMGAGYVALSRFDVGRRKDVFPDVSLQPFNWPCMGRAPVVTRLAVKQVGSEVVLERCTASDWTWEKGYEDMVCESEAIK
ncbi:MAG TPA: hypothetical protein VLC09_13850, partial [Polyangiaceae bacterium]|nr:hypothetical protein [Polyangiaceae bacterium]